MHAKCNLCDFTHSTFCNEAFADLRGGQCTQEFQDCGKYNFVRDYIGSLEFGSGYCKSDFFNGCMDIWVMLVNDFVCNKVCERVQGYRGDEATSVTAFDDV